MIITKNKLDVPICEDLLDSMKFKYHTGKWDKEYYNILFSVEERSRGWCLYNNAISLYIPIYITCKDDLLRQLDVEVKRVRSFIDNNINTDMIDFLYSDIVCCVKYLAHEILDRKARYLSMQRTINFNYNKRSYKIQTGSYSYRLRSAIKDKVFHGTTFNSIINYLKAIKEGQDVLYVKDL